MATAPTPSTFRSLLVADGVRTHARAEPGRVALREPDGSGGFRSRTYGELADRIARVASLTRHGLGLAAGDRTALLAPSCIAFVEVLYGLADANTPPAVLTTRTTADELRFACEDCGARVLFVHPDHEELARDAAPASVERIIVLGEELDRLLADASPGGVAERPHETDTFCILYTSGSTGRAKGVMLPHRQRTTSAMVFHSVLRSYGPADRALGISPLYHGGGLQTMVATLLYGGQSLILPSFDPEQCLDLIEQERLTSTVCVPTHLTALLAAAESGRARDLSSLRTIGSNASPMNAALRERIVERFGMQTLHDMYGSTDGGLVSALMPDDQLRKPHTVGQLVPGVLVSLRDESGAEVPLGEPGELFIASPYLSNGYWNRPDDQAKAFRDGWFTAGDVGVLDSEGYLALVDRTGDRIVTGGVNVYPREVEEQLVRHPAVHEAVVFGVPDDYWGEKVHAVVSLRAGSAADPAEIVAFCKGKLGGPAVPKGVDVLPEIPKNASGKLDRKALRAPHWAGRGSSIS
jgi:long-chain acyl-CoA synthetase